MDRETLRTFLLGCTVANAILLLLSAAIVRWGRGFVHRLHGPMLGLAREDIDRTLYAFLALYKLLILVFNLVPYLVLVAMG